MKSAPILILVMGMLLLASIAPSPISHNVAAQQTSNFVELVDNRTRHSKLFQDLNNPLISRVDVAVAPLHWLNGSTFEDINNTIIPSTANVPTLGLADLEMTEDDFEWFALDTFNTIPLILFRNKSALDTYVNFNPQALQWTNDLDDVDIISQPQQGIVAQVSDNTLLWEDAYGAGRNLTITLQPNQMMKLLQFDAAPPPPAAFIPPGGNPAVELIFIFDFPSGPNSPDIRVDGVLWDQSSRIETVNEVIFELNGEPLFVFTQPTFFDSGTLDGNGTFVLSRQGNSLFVQIRVPQSFWDSATYPAFMDPTINVQVDAGSDDAEERVSTGSVTISSGDIEFPYNEGNEQIVGFRFNGITVPNGATITDATVQFTAEQNSAGSPDVTIVGEDDDDAPTFTTTDNDISDRTQTSAFVDWSPPSWSIGDRTSAQETPDISTIIKEIVDRGGWSSGNSLVIIIKDDGSSSSTQRDAESYNGDPDEAAEISITYSDIDIFLTNETLDPTTGNTTTFFNFTIDYNNSAGNPADVVRVNVSDATNGTFNNLTMTRIGPGPNATYFINTTLPVGFYVHFFWANDTVGTTNFTTTFAGPVVSLIPPAVTTLPASPVLGESARLQGDLTSLGSASQVNVSFQWGDTMSLGNSTPDQVLLTTDTFNFNLTGLMTSTQYFFRARANNSEVVFGAILNFTTQASFVEPNVMTTGSAVPAPSTVTFIGSLTDFGELNITQVNVSFEWGFSAAALDFNTTRELLLNPADPFDATVTGLSPGSTIFFRARADWNGTAFGAILSVTLPADVLIIQFDAEQLMAIIICAIWLLLVTLGFIYEEPILEVAGGAIGVAHGVFLFVTFTGGTIFFVFIGIGMVGLLFLGLGIGRWVERV